MVRLLSFIGWPVVAGMIAAAVLLWLFPSQLQIAQPEDPSPTDSLSPTANGDWNGQVSYAEAVRRAAPSVVSIYTTKQVRRRYNPILDDPFFQQFFNLRSPRNSRPVTSLGSGVILSEEGHILTNYHVVQGAEQIQVQLADGRSAIAQIVGNDVTTDLTVLKVDLPGVSPISIGDSMNAQVGDVVLAIGNPQWVGQTVTQGIISATRRQNLMANQFTQFIQTDAAINPGNSGGALVDAHGNLLGINTQILDKETYGISFAIPSHLAVNKVMKDIVEHGRVIRGWVGVNDVQALTADEATRLGLGDYAGLVVLEIVAGSPAEKAGLKAGDLITHVNNHSALDQAHLSYMAANMVPGDEITMSIIRGGEALTLTAVAEATPETTPTN
ncbi:trypsin-like peptidase domain-containing protein [Porticoccaceae bacterium LTM1]|nr:trypsin-like peptidase domain-containing protein [Porticoccaceae bacterium LTM1]